MEWFPSYAHQYCSALPWCTSCLFLFAHRQSMCRCSHSRHCKPKVNRFCGRFPPDRRHHQRLDRISTAWVFLLAPSVQSAENLTGQWTCTAITYPYIGRSAQQLGQRRCPPPHARKADEHGWRPRRSLLGDRRTGHLIFDFEMKHTDVHHWGSYSWWILAHSSLEFEMPMRLSCCLTLSFCLLAAEQLDSKEWFWFRSGYAIQGLSVARRDPRSAKVVALSGTVLLLDHKAGLVDLQKLVRQHSPISCRIRLACPEDQLKHFEQYFLFFNPFCILLLLNY